MSTPILTADSSTGTTRLGAESIRQVICEETATACGKLITGLTAIILTGSMARDEASIATEQETTIVLGDAEFLLVFKKAARVPSAAAVAQLAKAVESRLIARKINCRICFSPVSTAFLEGVVPSIFAYELRHWGQVILGDRDVLARIPVFDAKQIPADDALRLLCNRIVELLELAGTSGLRSRAVHYATVKLYLDMATSFLVFAGAYRPTYQERLNQLRKLATDPSSASGPFPLQVFAELVEHCTHIKLSPSCQPARDSADNSKTGAQLVIQGIRFARLLWRWELQRLLMLDPKTSDEELLTRWASSQTGTTRLRGWVRVLRDVDSETLRNNGKRWLGLARGISPRLGIYAAGCQLCFRIPDLAEGRPAGPIETLVELLPISPEQPLNNDIEWTALAVSIGQNYHRFVEFTRT